MRSHRLAATMCIAAALAVLAGAPATADIEYWLDGMPEYEWYGGCSPTSGGHLIGYWDNKPGYENLYAGTAPMTAPTSDPFYDTIASPEHINATYNAEECTHTRAPNSLACFMHTTPPPDGGSYTWNISTGMRRYAAWDDPDTAVNESVPFTSVFYSAPHASASDAWNAAAFNFSDLRREIHAGRPLIFNLSLVGGGHSVAAYGYRLDDNGDPWFAVRDTWMDGQTDGMYGVYAEMSGGQEWWRFTLHQSGYVGGEDYYLMNAVPFVPNRDGPIVEETDFGNTWDNAVTIESSAETIYASLTDSDQDWYRIWLDAGDRAVVNTQDDEGQDEAIDTFIAAYDQWGNQITWSNDLASITNVSSMLWEASESSYYYVGVTAGQNSGMPQTGDYALTYYRAPAPEPGTIVLVSLGLAAVAIRRRRPPDERVHTTE